MKTPFFKKYLWLLIFTAISLSYIFIADFSMMINSFTLVAKGVVVVCVVTALEWVIFGASRPSGYLKHPWAKRGEFIDNEVDHPVVENAERLFVWADMRRALFIAIVSHGILRCLV